jgi:hypothetical protein
MALRKPSSVAVSSSVSPALNSSAEILQLPCAWHSHAKTRNEGSEASRPLGERWVVGGVVVDEID